MTTLVSILHERARTDPDQLATIAKKRGRWIPTTVGEFERRVAATAVGLAQFGLAPGQRVALMLGNTPDWLVVDLAVQAVGATSVAVPTAADHHVTAQLLVSLDVSLVVVEDPVDAAGINDRFDASASQPPVRFLCLGDDEDGFTGLDGVVRNGIDELDRQPQAFSQLVARLDPDGAAGATFTAGAGSRARPIVHSASALLAQARRVVTVLDLGPQDVTVVSLDPSHPFERALTLYPAVLSGAVLAYPENAATIAQSMLEVRPTFVHLPVDRVRAATASVHARFRRNRGLKRLVARWWDRSASGVVQSGGAPSRLAVRVVGRPALKSLGWENLRSLLITGSRVPLDVLVTMQALGAPVLGGYATVETGLIAAGTPRSATGLDVLDELNVSLRNDELVVSGEGLSTQELNNAPAAVESAATVNTGDVVRLGDGTVAILGPKKSAVLVHGRTVLTAEVEASLRDSPYIALTAVRAGDGGLRADIEIDFDSVSDWAAERDLHFTTFSSLVGLDAVRSLIAEEVARLAATDVAHHDLLSSPFQQDRDITRTRSIIQRGPEDDVATRASFTEYESAVVE